MRAGSLEEPAQSSWLSALLLQVRSLCLRWGKEKGKNNIMQRLCAVGGKLGYVKTCPFVITLTWCLRCCRKWDTEWKLGGKEWELFSPPLETCLSDLAMLSVEQQRCFSWPLVRGWEAGGRGSRTWAPLRQEEGQRWHRSCLPPEQGRRRFLLRLQKWCWARGGAFRCLSCAVVQGLRAPRCSVRPRAVLPVPRCAGAPPVLRAPPWGQAEARPGCGPVGGPGFSGAHGWAGLWAPGDGSCCAMAGAGADSPGSWRGALGHGGALGTVRDRRGQSGLAVPPGLWHSSECDFWDWLACEQSLL